MKKLFQATLLCSSLITGTALAAPIVITANNVAGTAEVTYGFLPWTVNNAPELTIDFTVGSLTHNMGDYTPGDYFIDFSLDGFWIDYDEDGSADFTAPPVSFTSATPVTLGPLPPLSGSDGALSWDIDMAANSIWISYDFDSVFDTSAFGNSDMNGMLALADLNVTGNINGVMNTNFGWESLTLRLDPLAVPEPSLCLLGGIGLIAASALPVAFAAKLQ